MKFRRVLDRATGKPTFLCLRDDAWTPAKIDKETRPQWLDAVAWTTQQPDDSLVDELLLPFLPRSYRDFMLFEQHVIDASRGYIK